MQTLTCSDRCWLFSWCYHLFVTIAIHETHTEVEVLQALRKLRTESRRKAILKQTPEFVRPFPSAWCWGTGWLPVRQGLPKTEETSLCWRHRSERLWWGTNPSRRAQALLLSNFRQQMSLQRSVVSSLIKTIKKKIPRTKRDLMTLEKF